MSSLPSPAPATASGERTVTRRHYLMCRPTHFEVVYAINPWMDTAVPVDTDRAVGQWEQLADTYRRLGHQVELIDPVQGLPDMVYAANGALVTPGGTVAAKFTFAERAAEAPAYATWLDGHGFGPVADVVENNEGEGDFLVVGERILAGTGFRTTPAAHAEVSRLTGMPVVTLQLVDPRFYHLDTALSVLDAETVAYYPGAFAPEALETLQTLYPNAIVVDQADALLFGLNAVSDGKNVVLTAAATGFMDQLRERGFEPTGIDLSELMKGGGSVKCCTLELRAAKPGDRDH